MFRYVPPQSADLHTDLLLLSAGWFTTAVVYVKISLQHESFKTLQYVAAFSHPPQKIARKKYISTARAGIQILHK